MPLNLLSKKNLTLDTFWQRKLTSKVRFRHLLTHWHYVYWQKTIISFEEVEFWLKISLILYLFLWNLTTHITIYVVQCDWKDVFFLLVGTWSSQQHLKCPCTWPLQEFRAPFGAQLESKWDWKWLVDTRYLYQFGSTGCIGPLLQSIDEARKQCTQSFDLITNTWSLL